MNIICPVILLESWEWNALMRNNFEEKRELKYCFVMRMPYSGNYMEGKFDKLHVPARLDISMDIELQMLGERLLEGKIGSIVAIEPSTGEVLCLFHRQLMIQSDDWT